MTKLPGPPPPGISQRDWDENWYGPPEGQFEARLAVLVVLACISIFVILWALGVR